MKRRNLYIPRPQKREISSSIRDNFPIRWRQLVTIRAALEEDLLPCHWSSSCRQSYSGCQSSLQRLSDIGSRQNKLSWKSNGNSISEHAVLGIAVWAHLFITKYLLSLVKSTGFTKTAWISGIFLSCYWKDKSKVLCPYKSSTRKETSWDTTWINQLIGL